MLRQRSPLRVYCTNITLFSSCTTELSTCLVINPQAQATQPKDVRCTVYMNVKTAIERTFLITRFIQLLHAPMFSPFLQRYINIYICNSSEQRWWGTVFWKTIISEKVQGNDFDSRKHTHDARARARAHTHTHTRKQLLCLQIQPDEAVFFQVSLTYRTQVYFLF